MNENSLAAVNVDREALERFLKEEFLKSCKEPIGIIRVARALGVTTQGVEMLVRDGCFHYAAWNTDRSIDGPSFECYCMTNVGGCSELMDKKNDK